MDVADLIELLSQYPEDMRVAKATDGEWNSIGQINGAELALTDNGTAYEIDVRSDDELDDDEIAAYTEILVIW